MEMVTLNLQKSWKEGIKEMVENKLSIVKKYEKRRKWVSASKRGKR